MEGWGLATAPRGDQCLVGGRQRTTVMTWKMEEVRDETG